MKILLFGKYPPIQGGTSSQTLNTVRALAAAGHEVDVVTNAREAEPSVRCVLTPADEQRLVELQRSSAEPAGGRITVHDTTPLGTTEYMPWAEPYVTKLAGIGLHLASHTGYDLIVGWYFEPYGVAAGIVAETTGRPLVLRHAGSDLGRLTRHPDLARAYRWLLGRADRILTGPRNQPLLTSLGAAAGSCRAVGRGSMPDYFDDPPGPIDLTDLASAAAVAFDGMDLADPVVELLGRRLADASNGPLSGPVIGVCGKVAVSKGSYDLVAALERVAAGAPGATSGGGSLQDFTLLGAVGGHEELLAPFLEAVAASPAVSERAVMLGLVAPWRIPSFVDACDLVCVLERRFDVALHRPRLPEEVLCRGGVLVISGEVAGKMGFADRLVDRENCLIVDDPADIEDLARVLGDALADADLRQRVSAGARGLAAELGERHRVDGPAAAIEAAMSELGGGTGRS